MVARGIYILTVMFSWSEGKWYDEVFQYVLTFHSECLQFFMNKIRLVYYDGNTDKVNILTASW